MSNELINALETRVTSAVGAIEGLRTENEGLRTENSNLREERQILENKLRELLDKMDLAENGDSAPSSHRPDMSSLAGASSDAAPQEPANPSMSNASSAGPRSASGSTQQSGGMGLGSGLPGRGYVSNDY